MEGTEGLLHQGGSAQQTVWSLEGGGCGKALNQK